MNGVLTVLAIALEHGPELAREVAKIFERREIDVSGWEAVFALMTGPSVEEYRAKARAKKGRK